jgi:Flp pilus assembly protein TadD
MLGAGAHAATDNAQSRFAEARAAFDAEEFARALRLFEECLALGMQGPAVHFNIGVAAYRSGELARAERAFREVAATPAMAALAYYNLGMVRASGGKFTR